VVRLAALVSMAALGLGCGRVGFDARALVTADAGADTGVDGAVDSSVPDTGRVDPPPPLCFAPRRDIVPCSRPECTAPDAVDIADMNGDGVADVVIGDGRGPVVAVHLGRGDGTFEPPADYEMQWGVEQLRIADLDEDRAPDVVACSWNSRVRFFRNQGDGTLAAPAPIAGPSTPMDFDLADLDADGDFDMASAGEDNMIKILFGNGDGTFGPHTTIIDVENYYAVKLVDVNGDGRLDILATDWFETLNVLVQGATPTTFAHTEIPVAAGPPVGIAAGDFDFDGDVDVALAIESGFVTVLLGDGSGTSYTPVDLAVPPSPVALTQRDLNGDGRDDLVVGHYQGGALTVLLASADGLFGSPLALPLDAGSGASTWGIARTAIGDVNDDGAPDIVATNPAAGHFSVFVSTPCGAGG
jgi:hypothetical protein